MRDQTLLVSPSGSNCVPSLPPSVWPAGSSLCDGDQLVSAALFWREISVRKHDGGITVQCSVIIKNLVHSQTVIMMVSEQKNFVRIGDRVIQKRRKLSCIDSKFKHH